MLIDVWMIGLFLVLSITFIFSTVSYTQVCVYV